MSTTTDEYVEVQDLIDALRRLLLYKFQLEALDTSHEARLQAASPEALDRYFRHMLVAKAPADVFDHRTIAEYLKDQGWIEGWIQGHLQVRGEAYRKRFVDMLRRGLCSKFLLKTLDASYEAHLSEATLRAIGRYTRRALTADSLAAVFENESRL